MLDKFAARIADSILKLFDTQNPRILVPALATSFFIYANKATGNITIADLLYYICLIFCYNFYIGFLTFFMCLFN